MEALFCLVVLKVDLNMMGHCAGPEELLGGHGAGEGLLRWLENAEGRQEKANGLWICWWEGTDQCTEEEHHPAQRASGTMQFVCFCFVLSLLPSFAVILTDWTCHYHTIIMLFFCKAWTYLVMAQHIVLSVNDFTLCVNCSCCKCCSEHKLLTVRWEILNITNCFK